MSDENFSQDEDVQPKKPRRKVIKKTTEEAPEYKIDDRKIERRLNDIYQDDNGRMPDMRHIRRARGESFFAGVFKFLFSLAILSALVWAGFAFLNTASKFSDTQVDLKIIGPQDFTIGATTTYQIVFKNSQSIPLNKTSLLVNYPAGFNFVTSSIPAQNTGNTQWDFDTLPPNDEKTLQITGKMFASLEDKKSWRVLFNYTPQNFRSELQKIATLDVHAAKTPISVSIAGLDKVSLGSEIPYTVTIENKGGANLGKLAVTPILPANFILTSSSIPLINNAWNLEPTTSTIDNSKYVVNFSGRFTSTTDESAAIKVQVKLADNSTNDLVIGETTLQTQLIKNSVIINTAVNGSLTELQSKPGDILNFTIAAKNFGKENVSKAQIKIVVDSPSYNKQSILSWSEIADKNDGDINGSQISDTVRRATMIWNEKKINVLAVIKPNSTVALDFQLPVKATGKAPWNQIEGNQITVTTEITYTDSVNETQTFVGNPITIILNSDTDLQIKNEISSDDKERERHDITWIINNTFHPLKNIIVSADIYGDTTWTGPSSTSAGTVQFDPNSKHLIWSIAEMTENTDVLTLPFSVVINKKNPTQNTLVSKVHLIAEDTVSGKKIELISDEIPLK